MNCQEIMQTMLEQCFEFAEKGEDLTTKFGQAVQTLNAVERRELKQLWGELENVDLFLMH